MVGQLPSTRDVNNLNEKIQRTLRGLSMDYKKKFEQWTVMESVSGEKQGFDVPGSINRLHEKKDRYGQVPLSETHGSRRWMTQRDYEGGEPYDGFDRLRRIADPKSWILQAHAAGGNRKWDETWVHAALQPAYVGKNGDIPVGLPASQIIPHNGQGMTSAKLQAAQGHLERICGPDEMPVVHMTSVARNELINDPIISSIDYNVRKPLVDMTLPMWNGMALNLVNDFLDDQQPVVDRDGDGRPDHDGTSGTFDPILPVEPVNIGTPAVPQWMVIRRNVVCVKSSVMIGELLPYTTEIIPGTYRGMSIGTWVLQTAMSVGGTRSHESKVMVIETLEDPANDPMAARTFGQL